MDSPTCQVVGSFFPDAQSQAATTCQGAQLTHVAVSVALALGFLLILLVLGATCVLRRTQVSVTPQLPPVSLSQLLSESREGRKAVKPWEPATWETPAPTQSLHQGPLELQGSKVVEKPQNESHQES